MSHLYIHGPGGILRETEVRRQRRQAELRRQQQQQQRKSSKAKKKNGNGGNKKKYFLQEEKDDDDDDDDFDHDRQDSHFLQEEAQLESLRKLDRHPALLLNADYQPMSWLPLSLWNWQEAVKAVFSGKVTVVDVYPDVTIRAANLEVPLPAVIALTEYVPLHAQVPAFTKRNVFLRDEYRCQYCLEYFTTRDLSLDHVVPRCKGGRLHWENAVTCCRKCNGRKGSLDVQEISRLLGMRLQRPPHIPTQYELAATASRMLPRRVHPTWEPYLGIQQKQQTQATTSTSASALNNGVGSSSSSRSSNSARSREHSHAAALEEEF